MTTALLQGINTQVGNQGETALSWVLGYGMFYGGLVQLIAGILEYKRKNVFGMVAFCRCVPHWHRPAEQGGMLAVGGRTRMFVPRQRRQTLAQADHG